MIRTRVGYTGGRKLFPTYQKMGDHAEALQIDFDPRVVTYRELLAFFWDQHSPQSKGWSTQYRAAVFFLDEAQRAAAERSRDEVAVRLGIEVQTAVEPAGVFYPAEDYHQKWYLRNRGEVWLDWLSETHRAPEDLRDSTAAARLNGYFAGHTEGLSPARLAAELGLAADDSQRLAKELRLQL